MVDLGRLTEAHGDAGMVYAVHLRDIVFESYGIV